MQQKILLGLILTLIIAIFIPVYWAMEPGRQEAARLRQQTEAAERGAKEYSSLCATCHGVKGEGIVGPALKSTRLDEDTLQKTIARGVPKTAMPAWGKEDHGPLNQQQVKDLATFIKNWDSTLPAPAPIPTTPPVAPTAPDASKLFATNCVPCHGSKREGITGLGPALNPTTLAKLTEGQVKEAILKGRPGTVMAGFEGRLTSAEIDALVKLVKDTAP